MKPVRIFHRNHIYKLLLWLGHFHLCISCLIPFPLMFHTLQPSTSYLHLPCHLCMYDPDAEPHLSLIHCLFFKPYKKYIDPVSFASFGGFIKPSPKFSSLLKKRRGQRQYVFSRLIQTPNTHLAATWSPALPALSMALRIKTFRYNKSKNDFFCSSEMKLFFLQQQF